MQHNPLTESDIQEIERIVCGTGYKAWIRHIADNPGIKTHELPRRSKGANNPADISRKMNQRLIPHGWQIVKQVLTKPTESWGWWIVRIEPESQTNE